MKEWEAWGKYWGLTIEDMFLFTNIKPEYIDRGIDFTRDHFDLPWQSVALEGILGTEPIILKIIDIKTSNGGDAKKMAEQILLYGDGTFQLPKNHTVPIG